MTIGSLMTTEIRTLLNTHGYDLTFRRTVEGSYNPATGTTGGSSNSDETVRGIYLRYTAEEIDGTAVQRGDRKLVISAVSATGASLSKTPQSNDKFIGEGNEVKAVMIQTIKSGASVIAYICQVRD